MKRLSLSLALLLGLLSPVVAFGQDAGGAGSAAAAPAASAPAASAAPTTTTAAPAASSTTSVAGDGGSNAGAGAEAAGAGLTPNIGESDSEYLLRVMQARDGDGTVTGDSQPVDQQEQQQQTPPAEGEGEQQEQKGSEESQGEGAGGEEFDPFAAPLSAIAPQELNAKIEANPALKAALEADPQFRELVFSQSRLAAETQAFKEVFHDAAEAKLAQQASTEYTQLSSLVTAINKPEDAQGFYTKLLDLSVLRDDDGNPVMQDGKPVSDGTVGRLIHHTGALFLNHFEQVAKGGEGDDELTAAVEILKDRAFGDRKAATTRNLTAEQQAKQQELDAKEQSLLAKERASFEAQRAAYKEAVTTATDTYANGQIEAAFKKTDLPEAQRVELQTNIRNAADKLLQSNPTYLFGKEALESREQGPKTQQALIKHEREALHRVLPGVIRKLVAEAGAKQISRQEQQQQRQTQRLDASRSEVAGVLRTAKPVQLSNTQEVTQRAIDNVTAARGNATSTGDLLAEIMRLRGGN